jgi:peroxiredoxin
MAGALLLPCAQAVELGDPAPKLAVAQWIKGGPVELAKSTNIHVIEFWATWCPPCLDNIPHLTELQSKFKDQGVVIVGVSPEDPAKVAAFAEKMGDKMAYVVAADEGEKTFTSYLNAFGVTGIPHAFVVDREGRLAWHGNPADGLEDVIVELTTGRFDVAAAAAQAKLRTQMEAGIQAMTEAAEAGNSAAFKSASEGLSVLLLGGQSPAGVDAGILYDAAWSICDNKALASQSLPLARRLAEAAVAASGDQPPAHVLSVLGQTRFLGGDIASAAELARRALACAPDEEKQDYEDTVLSYEYKLAHPEGPPKLVPASDQATLRALLGEETAVEGEVKKVTEVGEGSLTLLEFGDHNKDFAAVIRKTSYGKFPADLASLAGKRLRVAGMLHRYHPGQIQVVLEDSDDLTLLP